MSLFSSRVSMIHRCDVVRDASAASVNTDAWGNPLEPDWVDHLGQQPCRAWTLSGSEPVDDDRTVVAEQRRISMPLDTDITERDRILTVQDRLGNDIFPGPMGIEAVLRFDDHIEVAVEQIR